MWYVIQVKSGEERQVKAFLDSLAPKEYYGGCFIPLFEDVRRSGRQCRIGFRMLFPGYVFVESSDPERLFEVVRSIPRFTRLLGCEENDGRKFFETIGKDDYEFINSLFADGIMHLSYVHLAKNGRIDRVAGPLSAYRDCISRLEYRHRAAVVEAEMFGKKRRVKFCFWTDDDPKLPQIERLKSVDGPVNAENGIREFDIGIHSGDKVADESGIYGDQVFVVQSVDVGRRTVVSTFEMFGTQARIELKLDDVKKLD